MKTIEIKVNDKVTAEICTESRVIIIKGYADKCVMTINYPDDWYYTRAVQHVFSIIECTYRDNDNRRIV